MSIAKFILACVIFSSHLETATAKDPSPVALVGSSNAQTIDRIVDWILVRWDQRGIKAISSNFTSNGQTYPVRFEIYNSRVSQAVVYRGNCVASSYEKIVDCDLKLVDDLIADFRLIDIYGSNDRHASGKYRRNILKWILAHEVGHIVLRHGRSDFDEGPLRRGFAVFEAEKQKKELAADRQAVEIIGNLDYGAPSAYATVLDITNSLLRRAVCPLTFPAVCPLMPQGVGLIFDYTDQAKPIRIDLGGSHPAYVARFLRILYLAGMDTNQNSINYMAKQAILQLEVQGDSGNWISIPEALAGN